MSNIIVHTSDLTGDDALAFLHASALAAASATRLVTVHGNAPPETAAQLPDAAAFSARWGRRIDHARVCHQCCDDVTDTLLDALRGLAPRLVVTGSHGRHGLRALLHGSVGEALVRNLDVPTLVVPNQCRAFVDAATGAIDLHRIVVVHSDPTATAVAVGAARTLAALASATNVELISVSPEAIATEARDLAACVIVMPTRGHDGVRDALFGSHTDHVIRDAPCPVLAVPMIEHGNG
jgi:nucleotide-binding universal stress UspA family protein